jgi:hypothetical protein
LEGADEMTNIEMTQLQIKAFNKALSRADKANLISDDIYAAISDLIDPERMTKSGYGKAGKKYLESMSTEDLLAYGSDIEAAKNLLEVSKLSNQLDISGAQDPKGLLWRMYQKLEDAGYAFDSDQVRMVTEGEVNVTMKEMALKMNKYLTDEDYGLSDFTEWFNSQATLG